MNRIGYVWPAFAVVAGTLLVIFRKQAAAIAIRQRRAFGGRDWPLRSFELPMMLVGICWILWGVFMLAGTLVWATG